MLRSDWEFEYTGAALAEAAKTKLEFHQERLAWWKEKRSAIMTQIRSEGLEINEKISLGFRSPKSRDWEGGAQVMIRNDLQKALNECQEKLSFHTGKINGYKGWYQMLTANPHARKGLDIQDWLYFFSSEPVTDEETGENSLVM
jgi:hypothetical protein